MSAIEITAHDVETAIKTGLAQLTMLRAEVRIEVLDDGSRGVLGIRARPARVRLTPFAEIEAAATAAAPASETAPATQPATGETPAVEPSSATPVVPVSQPVEAAVAATPLANAAETSPAEELAAQPAMTEPTTLEEGEAQPPMSADAAQLAATLSQGVLDRMNFEVTCAGRVIAPQGEDESPSIWVDIQGKDANQLLSHQCEALDALQTIVQTMWAHQTKSNLRVTLDADSYKERREKRIAQMARRLAERVIASGRSITLEPMPPSERRLVHIALRDHPQVATESHGEGSDRRVTIRLK